MAIHFRGNGEKDEVKFAGAVLATGEMNYPDDSDFYAVVWDEEKQTVRRVEYATTRFGGTDHNSADIDATPEVKEKATESLFKEWKPRLTQQAVWEACRPDLHKRVKVSKKRGKDAGDYEGVVFWKKEERSQYGTWHYGWRYGVLCDDGIRRFYSHEQVTVIDPTEYYFPLSDERIRMFCTQFRHATGQGLMVV